MSFTDISSSSLVWMNGNDDRHDDSTAEVTEKTTFNTRAKWARGREKFNGWKAGLMISMSADILVFIIILVFGFVSAFKFPRDGAQVTLINGSCSKTKSYSTWCHLLINIFSTALLSSSSYAMQCILSPTIEEIRKAHTKGQYLKVGAPSLHNLVRIPHQRAVLFVMAALSSLPIHLLANSSIYEIPATNSYVVAVADQQFVDSPISRLETSPPRGMETFINNCRQFSEEPSILVPGFDTKLRALVPNMTKLSNDECKKAYSQQFIAGWRHVIAVTENLPSINPNTTITPQQRYHLSLDSCPSCRTGFNHRDPSIWLHTCTRDPYGRDYVGGLPGSGELTIRDTKISYCLAEAIAERCQLRAELSIIVSLLGVTAVKICVLLAIWSRPSGNAIVTLGDAIAAFLKDPDPTTRGHCLLTRHDVEHRMSQEKHGFWRRWSIPNSWSPGTEPPKRWSLATIKLRWIAGPGARAWMRMILFHSMLLMFIIAGALGTAKINDSSRNAALGMNFGAIDVNYLFQLHDMRTQNGMIGRALLVNTPQLLLSIFYFVYNGIWTDMLLAREWALFGRRKQGLRVSTPPKMHQRSNYFLTIPYQTAIPLQITSAVLHWLLSQAFFLVRVNIYPAVPFSNLPPSIINTVGFSMIGVIILAPIWVVLLIAALAAGFLGRLKSPIPLVGGNSLTISAACHPPPSSDDISVKLLKWGAIDAMEEHGIHHCSFSAGQVFSPQSMLLECSDNPWKRVTKAQFK